MSTNKLCRVMLRLGCDIVPWLICFVLFTKTKRVMERSHGEGNQIDNPVIIRSLIYCLDSTYCWGGQGFQNGESNSYGKEIELKRRDGIIILNVRKVFNSIYPFLLLNRIFFQLFWKSVFKFLISGYFLNYVLTSISYIFL